MLVISTHPDDEALGCGGSLLKHKDSKDDIAWMIITNISEDHGYSAERVRSRQEEIKKVAKKFGFSKTYKLDFPTTQLNSVIIGDMIAKISTVMQEFKPEIIYLPNRSDAHSDHRITFDAVMACTKCFRNPFIKRVLMYETVSETEFAPALPERAFIPNYFIDITPCMKEKLEILKIYKSEIAPHPFPRSLRNVEALATFRGAMSGVEYAEAFQLIKYIEK